MVTVSGRQRELLLLHLVPLQEASELTRAMAQHSIPQLNRYIPPRLEKLFDFDSIRNEKKEKRPT